MVMKYLLLSLIALGACSSKNELGDCVGVLNNKNPNLNYNLSVWNIIMAGVFSETLIVPAVVVLNQLECPVSKK